ncbi:FAS-associated factor 1 [Nematostella vectensis]|uniref:FAS-associated factor 1 n=1 Tax=Nematostella vectensis TaxID=45351 RepID=UPI0013906183|nr:FAS-associated factor 1 [Nematostella vectensis]
MAAEYGDREMILANFQSITGIENLDECITLLDHHNWDLTACVNSVLADQTDSPIIVPLSPSPEVQIIGESVPLHHPPRRVKFLVEWKDQTIPVVLDDTDSVGTIKRMLEMQIGIPMDQQSLLGWAHHLQITDNTILKDLYLKEETSLVLLTPRVTETPKPTQPCTSSFKAESVACSSSSGPNSMDKIMLNIKCPTKEFNLPYPITRTIGEVKTDLFSLTAIPSRNQCWSGWPDNTNDESSLAAANLAFPVHNLIMNPKDDSSTSQDLPVSKPGSSKSSSIDVDMDGPEDLSDDDEEPYHVQDDDDEMFADVPCPRQINRMLPDDCLDTSDNLIKFTAQFEERYGETHPHFYMGPLTEAIRDASGKSAKERRPLLLYLHHDGSILTNVFCSQLLCADTIINYISNNFVIWAWDMTLDTNKARLLDMVTQNFGSGAADTVRGFPHEQFPLLIVVMKNRSAMEVVSVLQGHVSLDELMTGLMSAHETFQQAMTLEIKDEEEREAREMVRREQDEAYQESLRQDQAKEEERRKQQEQEMMEKKLKEEQTLHEAQIKEAQRLSLVDQLPDEPGPECTEPISDLRFWLPNGERIQRRFLATSRLKAVLTFVQAKGYLEGEYKVVTNFPRRDLYTIDSSQTLQIVGLYPQEKIIVEER